MRVESLFTTSFMHVMWCYAVVELGLLRLPCACDDKSRSIASGALYLGFIDGVVLL